MLPKLVYNNTDKTVTVTLSNGAKSTFGQSTGWAIEKQFLKSNIPYESKTIDNVN